MNIEKINRAVLEVQKEEGQLLRPSRPATDIDHAFLLLDNSVGISIDRLGGDDWDCSLFTYNNNHNSEMFSATADTLPAAICLAWLKMKLKPSRS